MKKLMAVLLILCLVIPCVSTGENAQDGVIVKNYAEMLKAVNEKKTDHIVVSARYQHNSRTPKNLMVEEGRTVTISPEKDGEYMLKGRIDIFGGGTVLFDRVSIQGPDGSIGLWIGGGAQVQIGSVTGGKRRGNHGCAAVIVNHAHLTIDSAVGSDGTNGLGGDGIYAFDHSTVTVAEARGGSAKNGVGGAGVVVFGSASAVITGSAKGGDGLYSAGEGVLTGVGSGAEITGTAEQGTLIESKKPVDPDEITSRALLENAFRKGKTEIQLSPKYKGDDGLYPELFAFAASEKKIRVIGNPEGKRPVLGFPFYTAVGEWELDGIDSRVSGNDYEICLTARGDAKIVWNGDMTSTGKTGCADADGNAEVTLNGNLESTDLCLYAGGNAKAVLTGNATIKGKGAYAIMTEGDGQITVNGDVTAAADANAVVSEGGHTEINGNILAKRGDNYPVVYTSGGEAIIRGEVRSEGRDCQVIYSRGGDLTIEGNVFCAALGQVPIKLNAGAGNVTIHGDVTVKREAARAEGGTLTIDGDLIIQSKQSWALYSTDGDGKITLTGTDRRENP